MWLYVHICHDQIILIIIGSYYIIPTHVIPNTQIDYKNVYAIVIYNLTNCMVLVVCVLGLFNYLMIGVSER